MSNCKGILEVSPPVEHNTFLSELSEIMKKYPEAAARFALLDKEKIQSEPTNQKFGVVPCCKAWCWDEHGIISCCWWGLCGDGL